MYHAIVESRIRALFSAVSRGDAEPVLAGFAPRFVHVFTGASALGGERHSLAATREWYARLYRLLPDIAFTIERIVIAGTPWNTVAFIEWRETNSGTDGVRTSAQGVHCVHLKWGKMTRLVISPDTVVLERTLDRLAAAGVAEAKAAPIVD